MTDPTVKDRARPSTLKIVAMAVGLVLLLLLFGFFGISCRARAALKRLADEAPMLIAEIRSRDGRRPVLRGEPGSGLAWDAYHEALRQVEPLTSRSADGQALREFADTGKESGRDRARQLIREFAPALSNLAIGAGRADGMIRIDWDRGFDAATPRMQACMFLSALSLAQARALASEGRHREALDVLSDLMTFGRDLSFNSTMLSHMVGCALLGDACVTLQALVTAKDFPEVELKEAARRLEAIDSTWPSLQPIFLNELAGQRVSFLGPHRKDVADFPFAADILLANGIPRIEMKLRRSAAVSEGPWSEVLKASEQLGKEDKDSWNPLMHWGQSFLASVAGGSRCRRAQLRLVRAYLGWRIDGKAPALEDPFGGGIRSDVGGPAPRFWSRGKDGVDDGGMGTFDLKTGPDIVLGFP